MSEHTTEGKRITEGNTNGDNRVIELAEYHLRSVGLDPRNRQTFEDYVYLIGKVREEGLAEGYAVLRVAAQAQQAIYATKKFDEKEARGEELTAGEKLEKYYTLSGPPKSSPTAPGFERDIHDDRPPIEKLNDYFKRNK